MLFHQPKIIIYVTKQTVLVGLWHGPHYQSHRTYENQASEHAAFRQYIAENQAATIHLIVDVIEEEYQSVQLPHVAGEAGREMLSRKLTQFSRNSLYKTAWLVRQEKATRKENYYVLSGLTNTTFLLPLIDILQSEGALLVGVTTLPMVRQHMARSAKIVSPKLLVCERLSAGLRLTYCEGGRLRMSRLIPMEAAPSVDFYLAEVEKMRLYLLSQKIISDDSRLQVSLSALGAASDGVVAGLIHRGLECHIINRQHDIRKHYLQQLDVEVHPELLHMQWLANGNELENLAPVNVTKAYRTQRLSKRLIASMSMLIVVGILASGYFLYQGHAKSHQVKPLLEQAAVLSKKQALITNNHLETPVNSRDVSSAIMIAESVNKAPTSPLPLMQAVSAALDGEPDVVINRLRWVLSKHLHIKDEEHNVLVGKPDSASESKRLEMGFVNAEIQPFEGDYPAALATVSRIAEKLRSDTGVMSVSILQKPVNIVSSSTLQGNTSEQELMPTSATFKLKVIFKLAKSGGKT